MALQCRDPFHNLIEGRLAAARHAEAIVDLARAIDRYPDQEVMRLQEGGPLIVNQHAIGLQIVLNALVLRLIFLLQLNDLFEKLQSHQGWLAALPGENNLFAVLALDVLTNEILQYLVAHSFVVRLM